jgi:LmbE family N-acetylglucosaminyl deacetylase
MSTSTASWPARTPCWSSTKAASPVILTTATPPAAALSAAHHLPVIAWAIPGHVAALLNTEFGTSFAGRPPAQIDVVIRVDRATQLKAIACHASQSTNNPVLWRRPELPGDAEHLRYLRRKADAREPTGPA